MPRYPNRPEAQTLQAEGFLRIHNIIGCIRRGISPLVPIFPHNWLKKVRLGIYPQPVKIGARTTAWKTKDVKDFLAKMQREGASL
jgi:prophage regulatory protein